MLRSTVIKYIDSYNEERKTLLHYSGNTEKELNTALHTMIMQIRKTEQFLSYTILSSFNFQTIQEQDNFISSIHD